MLELEIPMLVCGRFGIVFEEIADSGMPILDRGRRGLALGRCRLGGRGNTFDVNSSGEALDGTRVEPAVVLGVAVAARLQFSGTCERVASDMVVMSMLGPMVLVIEASPRVLFLSLRLGVQR
mmetsp:Transcript_77642/g.122306  ORF Transcript_77642/g.122306 Transcript_77642/m.122306 type:complete len:122 (-) Transcript_77642:449-814(-)